MFKELIAKANRTTHPKQAEILMDIIGKFYLKTIEAGHSELSHELIEYHSQHVNPNDVFQYFVFC